ncbi:MAG TPA: GGDEF domain-containing protein [Solirubrobacterales bacterium]|nr:GGDEF domain-containing protein [Solirubrobacterales bacterium]
MPLGAAYLLAALFAIALGLLAPLIFGHFSRREETILAVAEAACLAAVAAGILLLVRRLRTSNEALWVLARRDELTGVGNYRALHERLAAEISRHERHGREFALVVLDLDGFKQVNERYGHLEGDRLLAEVGGSLRKEVRGEDSVFRQGGDEFAVIVPEVNAEEAEEVTKRLRGRISLRGFGSDEMRPITASTGYAMYPVDGRTIDELLGVADGDLSGAKQEARTRGAI